MKIGRPAVGLADWAKPLLDKRFFAGLRRACSKPFFINVAVKHFPDFALHKQGGAAIWFIPESVGGESTVLLENPDGLYDRPSSLVIKDQRKIKVGRVPLTVAGQQRYVYLKRFNAFGWRYRLGSLFLSSGAVRALRGAHVLIEAKIPAARPIAAVEFRRCGMLTKSFFVTEEIVGGKTAVAYWREELTALRDPDAKCRRRNFLRRLAALFHSLHDQNVYHNDLKAANILVAPSGSGVESFFLLDLEGIRRYRRLSRRRRLKNLVQLNRTLGCCLRRSEKFLFLKYYGERKFADHAEMWRWLAEINRQSMRLDRRNMPKRFWKTRQKNH